MQWSNPCTHELQSECHKSHFLSSRHYPTLTHHNGTMPCDHIELLAQFCYVRPLSAALTLLLATGIRKVQDSVKSEEVSVH